MLIKNIEAFFKSRSILSRASLFFILTIPIIAFGSGLLKTGNNLAAGDGDYYMQLYEAARISIFNYHQLPWWNPWVAGGVPLFANPQFGPISIQMLTAIFFGPIFGYKVALIIYLILGFWGLRKLLINYYKTAQLPATLLSYIWIFSSFFVYRGLVGHYTFFVIGFFPWILYFFLKRSEKRNWLWLALFSSAIIWSSMHYTTILSFFIVGLFGLGQLIELLLTRQKKNKENILKYIYQKMHLKKLIYTALVVITLTAPKIYATLEYTKDYPRILGFQQEPTTSVDTTWYALFGPDQYNFPPQENTTWGWHEVGTYIGVLTFFVFLVALYYFLTTKEKKRFKNIWLLVVIAVSILLARGDFASWAPFTLLRELPVFSSMRVATRWIAWAAVFILLFIGSVQLNKKTTRVVNVLLLATVLELFVIGSAKINDTYVIESSARYTKNSTFVQHAHWNYQRKGIAIDENFTEATRNNVGQIIAGDSLIDTRAAVKTVRCDESDPNCTFLSSNARLISWTPNKIDIERIASGTIYINTNAGSHWSINGVQNHAIKVVDPSIPFAIDTEDTNIRLEYSPPFTPLGMIKAIFNRLL